MSVKVKKYSMILKKNGGIKMRNLQEWIAGLFINIDDVNVKTVYMDTDGKEINSVTYKKLYDIPFGFIEKSYRLQSYTVEYSKLTPFNDIAGVTVYLVRKNTSITTLEEFINLLPFGNTDMLKKTHFSSINIAVYLYVDTFDMIECAVTFDNRYGIGICGDPEQVKKFNSYGKNYVRTIIPASGVLHILVAGFKDKYPTQNLNDIVK